MELPANSGLFSRMGRPGFFILRHNLVVVLNNSIKLATRTSRVALVSMALFRLLGYLQVARRMCMTVVLAHMEYFAHSLPISRITLVLTRSLGLKRGYKIP